MSTKRDEEKMVELQRQIAIGLDDLNAGRSQPLTRTTLEALKARARARLAGADEVKTRC